METTEENGPEETGTEKGKQPTEQQLPDEERVPTVVPDNDSGEPGPPSE